MVRNSAVTDRGVGALALAAALGVLLALAPAARTAVGGLGAVGARVGTILPRGWALERALLPAAFPRVDRAEAKLTTAARWGQLQGARFANDARLVWVVAASGEVRALTGLIPLPPFHSGLVALDARTGQPLGMNARPEAWPPGWDEVVDLSGGDDGVLRPDAASALPREEIERRLAIPTGVRSWLLPARAAATAVGRDELPSWLDPRREVWLVAGREREGAFYMLVDAHLGVVLTFGLTDRLPA